MQAGKLRQRVYFDAPATGKDAAGSPVRDAWVPQFEEWAEVAPRTSREQLRAAQPVPETSTLIVVRWSPRVAAIPATWRARHNGKVYDLTPQIHVDMRRREVQFVATAGANRG